MSIQKSNIIEYLTSLVRQYERIEVEKERLTTGLQAALAELNADRTALLDEANTQLARLNALRVAEGLPTITLAQLRVSLRPRRPSGEAI